MRAFENRRVLLGITGGVAAYKAAAVARLLASHGAVVDVVMTRSALEFIGSETLRALTGRRVHTDIFGGGDAIDHIALAQRSEVMIIAPATADFIARMAQGRADDLLSACVLASRCPVLVAPAMNDHMWSKAATQRNVAQLTDDGIEVLGPVTGPLAAGEGEGPGRMVEPDTIVAHAARLLSRHSALRGVEVVVTSGATRESLDPVRFISNRSTGKMGSAIAAAAWRRGAEVTFIAGAMSVPAPDGVKVVDVETTEEMSQAVRSSLASARVLIMAAAPADFRPSEFHSDKIEKSSASAALPLAATEDILIATADARREDCIVIGFALETSAPLEKARRKLERKRLHMIVLNDATEPGAGFGVDTNRVTLISREGIETPLPLLSKQEVGEVILDALEEMLVG